MVRNGLPRFIVTSLPPPMPKESRPRPAEKGTSKLKAMVTRPGGSEPLKALAHDGDLVARCIARARLDARGELTVGANDG